MILLAYAPALKAGFIWDDDRYVTSNPLLTAPDGLWKIWFSTEQPSQYFPLVYTTLRFEHWLWGLDPGGYHYVNILLHCANALLVWTLWRRLALPAPWLVAALFALHPVQVESVVWVSELKNLLSTFFYLLALLAWKKFIDGNRFRRAAGYGLSLLFCVMALLSKTTACTLPAAMLLMLWLQRKPVGWRALAQVAPFCAAGLAMALVSMWWEGHLGHLGKEAAPPMNGVERLLVVSHAVWFYPAKLIWPASLAFSYPRWQINWHDPRQYGWAVACLLAGLVLWWNRRRVGRGPAAAMLFFVAVLSPMLGFVRIYTFRYSFVADHYQYLAALGLFALFGAVLSGGAGPRWPLKFLRPVLIFTVLLVLGLLTWRQCGIYRTPGTLWLDTLSKNPGSALAYDNLGHISFAEKNYSDAIGYYQKAVEAKPENYESLNNLGVAYIAVGRYDDAIRCYHETLQIFPDYSYAYANLGDVSAAQGHLEQAVENYNRALQLKPGSTQTRLMLALRLGDLGRTPEAVAQYRQVLEEDPQSVRALYNLALIKATDADAGLRDGAQALGLAREACRLTRYRQPEIITVLAFAYAESGDFTNAVIAIRRAEDLATAAGKWNLADYDHQMADLFLSGRPFHQPPRSPASARGNQ